MGDIVLAGSTSGTTTLTPTAVSGTTTLTLPATTDTLVGKTTTDTLTNKTLTTPTISSLSSASATALTLQSGGTTGLTIDTSQNLAFNSGYGSVATAYGCRAWVNFNGTGTVAIRGSGNVSSITDNGTGSYTVNFTTSMPDVNYSAIGTVSDLSAPGGNEAFAMLRGGFATGSCPVDSVQYTSASMDVPYNCWAFFR